MEGEKILHSERNYIEYTKMCHKKYDNTKKNWCLKNKSMHDLHCMKANFRLGAWFRLAQFQLYTIHEEQLDELTQLTEGNLLSWRFNRGLTRARSYTQGFKMKRKKYCFSLCTCMTINILLNSIYKHDQTHH